MKLIWIILFSALAAVFFTIAMNGELFYNIFRAVTDSDSVSTAGDYLSGNRFAVLLIQAIASALFVFFALIGVSAARRKD